MAEKLESHAYEFDEFRVEPESRLLFRAGERVEIGERAFDVLLVLLQNRGKVLQREWLITEVWQASVDPNNLDQCLLALRNTFGDTSDPRRFIRSIRGKGLIFLPEVAARSLIQSPITLTKASSTFLIDEQGTRPPADLDNLVEALAKSSRSHLLVSCALYGALYAVGFLLETAYQFDRFWSRSSQLAVGGFFLVYITSWWGLSAVRKRTLNGTKGGLTIITLIFMTVGLLMGFGFASGLPDDAITDSKVQSLPAQAAYLKDVVYFLPLGLIYMAVPFHFVAAAEREVRSGRSRQILNLLTGRVRATVPIHAFYLRPLWLLVLLILALIGSQFAESRLLDNLNPGSHFNLFVKLVQVRRLVYFALGAECLFWYQNALNKLKRACT